MVAVLFIGMIAGFLGFGLCGLCSAATLQERGLAEWKSALMWGLLACCFLGLACLCTLHMDAVNKRHADARCECRHCDCGCRDSRQMQLETKEKDNGNAEEHHAE